jgi:hypothetical protein
MTHLFTPIYIGIMRILLAVIAIFSVAERGGSCFYI